MPKLLFFDVDGTLFDDETHQLPPSVVPALKKARENGCRIFVNTGRTLCNIGPGLQEIPLDGLSMGCGTRVVVEGETVRALEYSTEDSLRLLQVYRNLQIPTVYECDTAIYFDPDHSDDPMIPLFRKYVEGLGIARDIKVNDPDFRAVKMFCFIYDNIKMKELLEELKKTGMGFYAIDRGNHGYEMVPEGCSKASGIDIVRDKYGASLDDCYVFGDSRNDLSMLNHVKNSVVMGQAPDDVKACCSYVTDTPANDGIAKALKALRLI